MLEHRLNGLWAATIDSSSLRLGEHRFEINLHILDGDESTNHVIVMSGVRAFEYARNGSDEAWAYAELTSIEAKERDGLWQVTAELWSDILTVRCGRIEINGEGFLPQGAV